MAEAFAFETFDVVKTERSFADERSLFGEALRDEMNILHVVFLVQKVQVGEHVVRVQYIDGLLDFALFFQLVQEGSLDQLNWVSGSGCRRIGGVFQAGNFRELRCLDASVEELVFYFEGPFRADCFGSLVVLEKPINDRGNWGLNRNTILYL